MKRFIRKFSATSILINIIFVWVPLAMVAAQTSNWTANNAAGMEAYKEGRYAEAETFS
jgi:hypothetical protein